MPKKPKKNFNDNTVARMAVNKEKQQDIFDAVMPGLFLKTSPGGTKSWYTLWYYRDASGKTKSRQRLLGKFPVLSVKDARAAAKKFQGADPQSTIAQTQGQVFSAVVETFIKRHVEKNELRSGGAIKKRITTHLLPKWRDWEFSKITKGHVVQLLDAIEEKHGARTADLVLADFRRMAKFHGSRVDGYQSPVTGVEVRYSISQHRRDRTLNDEEIRALWTIAASEGTFGALVQFLLVTGQRREKARMMKFSDLQTVHFDNTAHDGVWVIATERREKGNAGTLRLPRLAIEIVERQRERSTNEHVFAGLTSGPINGLSKCKLRLDRRLREVLPDMFDWTLHDLRRTARTLMSRAKVGPISERILGHSAGPMEETYDQWHYFDEKAFGLEQLAALISEILNPKPANIVRLHA